MDVCEHACTPRGRRIALAGLMAATGSAWVAASVTSRMGNAGVEGGGDEGVTEGVGSDGLVDPGPVEPQTTNERPREPGGCRSGAPIPRSAERSTVVRASGSSGWSGITLLMASLAHRAHPASRLGACNHPESGRRVPRSAS